MASYEKEQLSLEDMLVRKFANDLRKINDKAPELKYEVITLSKHISELIEGYVRLEKLKPENKTIVVVIENNTVTKRIEL